MLYTEVHENVRVYYNGCQTFRTLTFSYPAFLKRVRVRYVELGIGLVLMLGLAVSVRISG